MPFVKLDCGILDSSLWLDRTAREVFVTALLMAEHHELREPADEIRTDSLDVTGFVVPPGWYGLVRAAGPGIVRRAGITDMDGGLAALAKLAERDLDSRSPEYDGRRMVRISGGFLILNFQKYREKDHTAAERQRRYRDRHCAAASAGVGYAEDFLAFWAAYPRKTGKGAAWRAWKREKPVLSVALAALAVVSGSDQWKREGGRFVPHPATWISQRRWEDEGGGRVSRVSGRDLGEWAARQRAGGAPLAQPPTTAIDLPAEGRP